MNATSRLKKRERTQNWAFEEKRYLLELCKRDMNIIENKRLDADLTALKNRAWKSVHEEFCKVFGNERNCNRLKEQWRRMKGKINSINQRTIWTKVTMHHFKADTQFCSLYAIRNSRLFQSSIEIWTRNCW